MAGPYFVDDGGNGSDGLSWANAETSINDLDTAVAFASGEIVYFGADSQCQASNTADLTITGPASGLPVMFISSTVGSGTTVSYAVGTANQIDTTEGAYSITLDGSFVIFGVQIASGANITLSNDANEFMDLYGCKLKPGAGGVINFTTVGAGIRRLRNCVIDLTADGTTNRGNSVFQNNNHADLVLENLTFVNAGYRINAAVIGVGNLGSHRVNGCDFSGFTNASVGAIYGSAGHAVFTNCLMASTWTPAATAVYPNEVIFTNCGPADAPTYIFQRTVQGDALSSASIYRTGGATVEGDACSWLITTTATCAEGAPFYTPWIYGTVGSTGSKTFDLYITNDTADFTDAECWLEVEYLSTSDEAIWALATDQRATITATAAAQTDDTTSTWNGTGPSFTYKQKLSVSATVGETGQYRARVAVGVASIAGSRYFYVDPKVSVT